MFSRKDHVTAGYAVNKVSRSCTLLSSALDLPKRPTQDLLDRCSACQSCHLMLLPHLPGKELPKLVTPFLFVVLNPVLYIVILLYMYSAHFLNCCFSCKGSCHASPSMYTCTLRVLYIVAESLYPLYTSFQLHRMV